MPMNRLIPVANKETLRDKSVISKISLVMRGIVSLLPSQSVHGEDDGAAIALWTAPFKVEQLLSERRFAPYPHRG